MEIQKRLTKANAKIYILLFSVVALLLIGLFSVIKLWNVSNQLAEAELYIQASDKTIADFKVKIQSDSTYKLEMAQRFGTEQNARILAEDEAKRLKKITAVVKTKVVVRVDSFKIPYHYVDTNNMVNPCDGIPYGTAFYLSDSTKYIAGVIDTFNVRIDSLGLPASDITVTIGEEKRGFLKKPKPVVLVDFDNPYLRPVSAQNIIVKDTRKKPILLSRTAMVIYGLVGGFLIYSTVK